MTHDKQALIDAIRAQWRTQLEQALDELNEAKANLLIAEREERDAVKNYEDILHDMEVEIARALADMEQDENNA